MDKSFFSDADRKKLRDIALEEFEELIGQIESVCGGIETGKVPAEGFETVKRAFHTIGGSAGLAGLRDISALGVEGETMMDSIGVDRPPADALNRIRSLAGKIEELARQARSDT